MIEKVKAVMHAILVVMWFYVSQLIIVLLALMLGTLLGHDIQNKFLLNIGAYAICMIGILWFDANRLDTLHTLYRAVTKKKIFKYIGFGLMLWLVTILLNALFIPFFPEYGTQINSLFTDDEHILRFITLVIMAPVVEEFIFRGKIQGILKTAFNNKTAMILQGLVFGLIHPFGLQKIYATVMGIGFGYIREREDDLVAPTIMHMMINAIGWMVGVIGYYISQGI